MVEGDLLQHAVAYATEVAEVRPLPKASERQNKIAEASPDVFDQFVAANPRVFKGFEAPRKNLEAIRAATQLPMPRA
jgi:3-hydroxyacyl-CoA dehydrogenase